jgi:hypothetical protein
VPAVRIRSYFFFVVFFVAAFFLAPHVPALWLFPHAMSFTSCQYDFRTVPDGATP